MSTPEKPLEQINLRIQKESERDMAETGMRGTAISIGKRLGIDAEDMLKATLNTTKDKFICWAAHPREGPLFIAAFHVDVKLGKPTNYTNSIIEVTVTEAGVKYSTLPNLSEQTAISKMQEMYGIDATITSLSQANTEQTIQIPNHAKTIELTQGLNTVGVGEVARKLSANLSLTSHGTISPTPEINGNVITFRNTMIGSPISVSLPDAKADKPVARIWSADPEDLVVRTLAVLLPEMLNSIVPGIVKTLDARAETKKQAASTQSTWFSSHRFYFKEPMWSDAGHMFKTAEMMRRVALEIRMNGTERRMKGRDSTTQAVFGSFIHPTGKKLAETTFHLDGNKVVSVEFNTTEYGAKYAIGRNITPNSIKTSLEKDVFGDAISRTEDLLANPPAQNTSAQAAQVEPSAQPAIAQATTEARQLTQPLVITLKGGVRPEEKIELLTRAIDNVYLSGFKGQKYYTYEGETNFRATGMSISPRDSNLPLISVRNVAAGGLDRLTDTEVTLSSSVVDSLPPHLRQGEAIKKELNRILDAVANEKSVQNTIAGILSERRNLAGSQSMAQPAGKSDINELRAGQTIELLRFMTMSERSRFIWRYAEKMGSIAGVTTHTTRSAETLQDQDGRVYSRAVFSVEDPAHPEIKPTVRMDVEKSEEFPDDLIASLAKLAIDETAGRNLRKIPLFEDKRHNYEVFEIIANNKLTQTQREALMARIRIVYWGTSFVHIAHKISSDILSCEGAELTTVSYNGAENNRLEVRLGRGMLSRMPAERCFRHVIEQELNGILAEAIGTNARPTPTTQEAEANTVRKGPLEASIVKTAIHELKAHLSAQQIQMFYSEFASYYRIHDLRVVPDELTKETNVYGKVWDVSHSEALLAVVRQRYLGGTTPILYVNIQPHLLRSRLPEEMTIGALENDLRKIVSKVLANTTQANVQPSAVQPTRIVEQPKPQVTARADVRLSPILAFKESQLIQAVQANNKTGDVYEANRFPIELTNLLKRNGIDRLESDILSGFRLSRQWTGNLDINTMRVDNFSAGEGREAMHRVNMYHGSTSMPMPQIIVREYSGFGGTVKIYGILGGENIASVAFRSNVLKEKKEGLQLALGDSRVVLVTASNAQILQKVQARCAGKKLEQESVTSPASPLLAQIREIEKLGRGAGQKRRSKH